MNPRQQKQYEQFLSYRPDWAARYRRLVESPDYYVKQPSVVKIDPDWEERLLNYVDARPKGITSDEAASFFSIPKIEASKWLARLFRKGVIGRRVGIDKKTNFLYFPINNSTQGLGG